MLSGLLRLLPPEAAHAAAIRALRLAPRLTAPSGAARRPRLATELWGRALPNPIGLAAGFDKNAAAVDGLFALGFGAVEVGTVTPRPQAGNPKPRLFRLPDDGALINRLGFNNQGVDAVRARLTARTREHPGLLGANIAMNRDAVDPVADYALVLRALYPFVDYVTVNVSSPNTPGLRGLQVRDRLDGLLRALLEARADLGQPVKPLLVKVAPDLEPAEAEAVAEVTLALGIDGLIVGNTTLARPPGLRGRHRAEAGGLSGRPLFAHSTELLARMHRLTGGRVTLVGVGGVASGADAYAKIRAGAGLVQLYTAMIYRGPGIVRRICAELDALLARDGFARVADAVGADARGGEGRGPPPLNGRGSVRVS